jgi:hypothetical protein
MVSNILLYFYKIFKFEKFKKSPNKNRRTKIAEQK